MNPAAAITGTPIMQAFTAPRTNGSLARVEKQLHDAGIETVVFDRVQANPLAGTIMDGAAFVKENNCDFIVALGGGSVMDASEPMDFVRALANLQKECGAGDLKMSEYGFKPEEFPEMAAKEKDTMGGLDAADRTELSADDTVEINRKSFR